MHRYEAIRPLATLLLRFVLALFVCLTLALGTVAYCPRTKIYANNEFFKSRFVIIATVLSERTEKDSEGFIAAWHYRVHADRIFRGPKVRFLHIVSENDSGRFPMESGQKYLLFVRRLESNFVVDNCGNSGLLSEAENILDNIRQIDRSGPYGEIDIRVEFGRESAQGIHFIARSHEGSFAVVSDKDGYARLRVPPGQYEVTATSAKFWLVPYDLNPDDPNHFSVPRGGCIQLDYDATLK